MMLSQARNGATLQVSTIPHYFARMEPPCIGQSVSQSVSERVSE